MNFTDWNTFTADVQDPYTYTRLHIRSFSSRRARIFGYATSYPSSLSSMPTTNISITFITQLAYASISHLTYADNVQPGLSNYTYSIYIYHWRQGTPLRSSRHTHPGKYGLGPSLLLRTKVCADPTGNDIRSSTCRSLRCRALRGTKSWSMYEKFVGNTSDQHTNHLD